MKGENLWFYDYQGLWPYHFVDYWFLCLGSVCVCVCVCVCMWCVCACVCVCMCVSTPEGING